MKKFIKFFIGLCIVFGISLIVFFVLCKPANASEMIQKVDYFSLLVDQSGSMFMKSQCSKEKKITVGKQAVEKVFDNVPESLTMNSELKTVCPIKSGYTGKYTRNSVSEFLKNDVPDKGSVFTNMTPLSKGVNSEIETVPTTKNAILLVTDGDYNLGKSPVESVKKLYAERPDTIVHIISLADTKNGRETIKKIASLKNGTVVAEACDLIASDKAAKDFAEAVFYNIGNAETVEIFFDVDRDVIKESEKTKLDSIKGQSVRVEGWASIDGGKEYNQALSERRAKAVGEYLGTTDYEGMGISEKYNKRKLNRRADVIIK